eukprot:g11634.t1
MKMGSGQFPVGPSLAQDPSSPHKRHWFGLGARQRSPPCEPEERAAGTSPVPDLEGGDGPGPLAMVHASGTTAEEFAVASQLLEGLYGKRLEAKKALDILGTVPEISWLVECYCMTPAQPGWRKSKTAPGDVPLYADEATGKVYEAMPCIRHYMRMAELALTARNLPEKADAAAAQLQHYVQSLQAEVRTTEAAWTGPHEDSESQGVRLVRTEGSAGYPKNFVILALRSYIFLAVNYICQVLVLYMIAKEELIWDAFAGQMFLCDFGRNAGDCPNGSDCVGGTMYTPSRVYSWGVWSTRVFVRDALLAIFPQKSEEIHQFADPGETLGGEALEERSINIIRMFWDSPNQAECWLDYEVPEWAEKESCRAIHGWSEVDLCKLKIAGMPLHWKIINLFVIIIPKLLLWWLTAQSGTTFLMERETSAIDNMVVNSVALAFILQIDELLCSELMSETTKTLLDMVQDYELHGYTEANQDYEKHLDADWSWYEIMSLVPYKLVVVLLFTMLFVRLYYWTHCVQNEDGGYVSREMRHPLTTHFSFLCAFFSSIFKPQTENEPFWNPTYCTSFILSVAEQLQDSDAFPQSDGRRPASNRASKDAPLAPKMPLRSLEDPWTSLEKLVGRLGDRQGTGLTGKDVDVESFLENLSQAQAPQADPSSPSGHSPVQLVATSPSAVRVRDVRSWQPVPRFEANQVALEEVHSPKKEAAAPELHSPTRRVPFRSEGKAGSQGKVDDVREWQPSPTRWDSSSLTREGEGGNSPYRDGRLRQSAEAVGEEACGGPTVSFAPLPPEPGAPSSAAEAERRHLLVLSIGRVSPHGTCSNRGLILKGRGHASEATRRAVPGATPSAG